MDGIKWWDLPAGQTYLGDAEIVAMGIGQATGQHYCKSTDGGIWAWGEAIRTWVPLGGR